MGFFSWKTADTNETIANVYADHPNALKNVYMLQPNGDAILETSYSGYGIFGGVDAYALLAKLNISKAENMDIHDDAEVLRKMGINLAFGDAPVKFPLKFSHNADAKYENLGASANCEHQGFFY